MAVTLSQVRTQIADRPAMYPPNAVEPEILGYGDGVATIFALSFENFIPGTLTVFVAPMPTSATALAFVAQPASAYLVGAPLPGGALTAATNQVITFVTPPAAGSVIAARYQATAFSDSDLQGFLTRAQGKYADDATTLAAVQYAIIDVILMDQRRMEMIGQGDFRRDRGAYQQSLRALQVKLFKDLEGGPNIGRSNAAIAFGRQVTHPYASGR